MLFVITCWLTAATCQFSNVEYTGPAYAQRNAQGLPVTAQLKGAALIWCVRVGMKPSQIERLFGSPLMQSRFRAGPEEWWYPELGVTIYFPIKLIQRGRPLLTPERIRAGII
jgi:outer membrane protein assembly factor BamE (lipoprotein component of BamABCDE complex)